MPDQREICQRKDTFCGHSRASHPHGPCLAAWCKCDRFYNSEAKTDPPPSPRPPPSPDPKKWNPFDPNEWGRIGT